MWITQYTEAVKRQLIDTYGFPENLDKPGCVLGEVPDGEYPMTINGRMDYVRIEGGKISCCNFDAPQPSFETPPTLKSG